MGWRRGWDEHGPQVAGWGSGGAAKLDSSLSVYLSDTMPKLLVTKSHSYCEMQKFSEIYFHPVQT